MIQIAQKNPSDYNIGGFWKEFLRQKTLKFYQGSSSWSIALCVSQECLDETVGLFRACILGCRFDFFRLGGMETVSQHGVQRTQL